jgi:hypothetical protein
MCFLCGEPVASCKDMHKVLSGDEFDRRIHGVISERGLDEWVVAVKGRMECSVGDLFAKDAVYHNNCHVHFIQKLPHIPQKGKRRRPHKENAMHLFDILCNKLENECENEMFTLSQLHDMMLNMAETDEDPAVYSKDYLKQLLKSRYGTHIYFTSKAGRDDVVGFSNFCDLVLHDKFFSDKIEGQGSEAEKIVKKAAGLILAEIRETTYSRDIYPTAEDVSGDGVQFLPPLLLLLLKTLIKSPLKQAALGQAVVQSARPQGCLMPLLFALGIDLADCGVNELHIKLARLGFAVSSDEIRRFKQSTYAK